MKKSSRVCSVIARFKLFLMKSTIDDFFDTKGEINEKYVLLKDHIKRIQTNLRKYGNR